MKSIANRVVRVIPILLLITAVASSQEQSTLVGNWRGTWTNVKDGSKAIVVMKISQNGKKLVVLEKNETAGDKTFELAKKPKFEDGVLTYTQGTTGGNNVSMTLSGDNMLVGDATPPDDTTHLHTLSFTKTP